MAKRAQLIRPSIDAGGGSWCNDVRLRPLLDPAVEPRRQREPGNLCRDQRFCCDDGAGPGLEPAHLNPRRRTMDINIGIDSKQRTQIADGLARLLADSYTLYLKTHNFHWNVTGPMFNTLHLTLEEQYTELAEAVDEIAERIRALGRPAPGSYSAFAELTSIKESEGMPEARDMIRQLVGGQEVGARTGKALWLRSEENTPE